MNNILKQIIKEKKRDLNHLKKKSFIDFAKNKMAIIAEIKLASPTIQYLGSEEDIAKRATDYEAGGASAISVITEKHFFKGNPYFISQIKKKVNVPVLQKDFVIDHYQIFESKIIGADSLLLIAKIVSRKTLIHFVNLCQEIGIEPIVEINDESDLKKALATSTKIIAVNARNLKTFAINVEYACELLKKIPDTFIKLGFSGVHSSREVKKYSDAGASGVLVGTSLMRTSNICNFIGELNKI